MVIGFAITQKKLPAQHGYEFDEFQCLNLNITCPKGSKPEDGLLAMVWMHGYEMKTLQVGNVNVFQGWKLCGNRSRSGLW
jgi:carboxylesterase type B